MNTDTTIVLMSGLTSVVVIAGAILALILTMPRPAETPTSNFMCLPDELETLQCIHSGTKYVEFLESVVSKALDQAEQDELGELEENNNLANIQVPFVKLTGSALQINNYHDNAEGMTTITDWQYDEDMVKHGLLISSQMEYKNGHVTVPINGHYFVNSFIELMVPFSAIYTGVDIKVQIVHSIFLTRKLRKVDEEITCNIQTYMVTSNDSSYVDSSQVSSLVKMEAGDDVFVKISNINFFKNSKSNEFVVRLVQQI